MNSEAFMDEFVSKPKIGRLPSSIVEHSGTDKSSVDRIIIKWLFLALVVSILIFVGYRLNKFSNDDARLLALISSTDEIIKAKNPELYFKDSEGVIAGQMVKISPDSINQATFPESANGTPVIRDKAQEKELLGIVGKY